MTFSHARSTLAILQIHNLVIFGTFLNFDLTFRLFVNIILSSSFLLKTFEFFKIVLYLGDSLLLWRLKLVRIRNILILLKVWRGLWWLCNTKFTRRHLSRIVCGSWRLVRSWCGLILLLTPFALAQWPMQVLKLSFLLRDHLLQMFYCWGGFSLIPARFWFCQWRIIPCWTGAVWRRALFSSTDVRLCVINDLLLLGLVGLNLFACYFRAVDRLHVACNFAARGGVNFLRAAGLTCFVGVLFDLVKGTP